MADLIIKNMEMRSACSGETDCFALDEYGDYPMCRITGETRGYTFPIKERCMDNCPLRPALEKPPQTKGDVIRAMTNKELAVHHAKMQLIGEYGVDSEQTELCTKLWLDWLQSPTDGGDGDG